VSDQRFVPSAVHCPACAAADAAIADGSDGLAIQLAIERRWPKSQVDWLVRQLTEESRRGGRMGA
jgi:hypothetical protein